MQKEYKTINGKVQRCIVFTRDEVGNIFGDDNWNRTFKDSDFLKSLGLNPPPGTLLTAGSHAVTPNNKDRVAGVCILRTDEKDAQKGYPVNWNHWDLISNNDKFLMIPKISKRKEHWFKSKEEWENYIKNHPPHETD